MALFKTQASAQNGVAPRNGIPESIHSLASQPKTEAGSDLITLTCPSCGSRLQFTKDIDRLACVHCGNEHIVRRGTGIVSLAPVVDGLGKVQVGVDKTAAELAVVRLRQEIAQLEKEGAIMYQYQLDQLLPRSDSEQLLAFGSFFFLLGGPLILLISASQSNMFFPLVVGSLVAALLCWITGSRLQGKRLRAAGEKKHELIRQYTDTHQKKVALLKRNLQIAES